MLLIVLPQDTEIPAVPVIMGFNGSGKSRRRSRDPREETKGSSTTQCASVRLLDPSVLSFSLS